MAGVGRVRSEFAGAFGTGAGQDRDFNGRGAAAGVPGEIDTDVPAGAPGICSRPAGLVIQALRHLRAEGLEEAQLLELRSRLEPSARTELAQLSPKLAAWMRPLVKKLTLEEKACGAYCN